METLNSEFISFLRSIGVGEEYLSIAVSIITLCVIFLLAYLLEKICRRLIVPIVRKVTVKTRSVWDDYLLNDKILGYACRMIPPFVISESVPFAFADSPVLLDLIEDLCWIYITIIAMKLCCSLLSALYTISSEHEKLKNHSLKGFYQMVKLIVICIGVIIIISILIDKNPLAILTGLGAGTAILMLVFQDTIKGLVAGVQLSANDMLRPGDWICMPKYGADGTVLEVNLTTVKVQNWDKTITTIPPFALVNDSFQNWRGMFESNGRRVKRYLNIDMSTVRFCTKQELDVFCKEPWMKGVQEQESYVNLYLFRRYVESYLQNHPKVSKEMTLMVRQLQPEAHGLPIELYFFSADTAWVNYESLQAEVFDHLLATLQHFGLRVFQLPSGYDIKRIGEA